MLTRDFLDERLVPELEQGTVQYHDHIRRYLFAQQFVAGKKVLDVACGTGYGSAILQRANTSKVISIDIDARALRYAKRRWSNLSLFQGNATNLPIASTSVDVVISFETLEHISEPHLFLKEIHRIIHPTGFFILSTPNRKLASPESTLPFSPYHAFEPTLDELKELLDSAQWTIERLHGMMHSERIKLKTPSKPFSRQENIIAWSAYFRYLVSRLLPPALYARLRKSEPIDISDSILIETADETSAYFVAVCRPTGKIL